MQIFDNFSKEINLFEKPKTIDILKKIYKMIIKIKKKSHIR